MAACGGYCRSSPRSGLPLLLRSVSGPRRGGEFIFLLPSLPVPRSVHREQALCTPQLQQFNMFLNLSFIEPLQCACSTLGAVCALSQVIFVTPNSLSPGAFSSLLPSPDHYYLFPGRCPLCWALCLRTAASRCFQRCLLRWSMSLGVKQKLLSLVYRCSVITSRR